MKIIRHILFGLLREESLYVQICNTLTELQETPRLGLSKIVIEDELFMNRLSLETNIF